MYRFQVSAQTEMGEQIGLCGAGEALGNWNPARCVRLTTQADRYPLWSGEVAVGEPAAADLVYKYLRLKPDGRVIWENLSDNRRIPWEPQPVTLVVEDGSFDRPPVCPYGYYVSPVPVPGGTGPKVLVVGSSVALGCSAWLLRGWAWHLAQALRERYGYHLVNGAVLGANITDTLARLPGLLAQERPAIVILALSLGNEGLATCRPQERWGVQRRFESGLQRAVQMVRAAGARPLLGSVYPHGHYGPEQNAVLRETHGRMQSWGVPVLDWLDRLDRGDGRWRSPLEWDAAHPNTDGQREMFEAIPLALFAPDAPVSELPVSVPVWTEEAGFAVFWSPRETALRLVNDTPYPYHLTPAWRSLQEALRRRAPLPGLYSRRDPQVNEPSSLAVSPTGELETVLTVPPHTTWVFDSTFHLFAPSVAKTLFYDGQLALLQEGDRRLRVVCEAYAEYNVHPMWREVRVALREMPPGVYEDLLHPDTPFRTLWIDDGLASRVKVPPRSTLVFDYVCSLQERPRVAILPLGDRCAARMLLYKMEFDGPAFPFDLTRTTRLSDVADILAQGFWDMWNPALLSYHPAEHRIYHRRWTGLSFAHEVEDTDNPLQDMTPVWERMAKRYSARAQRFAYVLAKADELLFIRTGSCDRGSVEDLLAKLRWQCGDKPFRLLLFSEQDSQEFAELPGVIHHNLYFNPDRMYADVGYWQHCTEVLQGILRDLGISSRNLFWCPPNPPRLSSRDTPP
ncbi:MAG: DUF1796 family putative cysteine peptidase [Pseudanabaenaceae cyanobacterium]